MEEAKRVTKFVDKKEFDEMKEIVKEEDFLKCMKELRDEGEGTYVVSFKSVEKELMDKRVFEDYAVETRVTWREVGSPEEIGEALKELLSAEKVRKYEGSGRVVECDCREEPFVPALVMLREEPVLDEWALLGKCWKCGTVYWKKRGEENGRISE